MTWRRILDHWTLVEVDFQELYGIDLGDRSLRRARSWRWAANRIGGLLSTADHRSRLQRTLFPPKSPAARSREKPTQ